MFEFLKKVIKSFYNLTDYENWKTKNNNGKGWNIKYYKGLGTSSSAEAKEYFKDLEKKLKKYIWPKKKLKLTNNKNNDDDDDAADSEESNVSIKSSSSTRSKKAKNDLEMTIENLDSDDECTDTIKLAFDKRRADDRKSWLMNYDKNTVLDNDKNIVPIPDFINQELIHFSNDDLHRSIPSLVDGLKPSQRKILYGTIKRKLFTKKDEIKVSQLAGFVSDKTCYHHGEKSLTDTIIGMAQNYVGSNNINILYPSGQFGSRLLGGKDSASPRYTFTYLGHLTRLIFREEDEPILNYLDDDGVSIEPEWYAPIIPMVLVNGAEGIGTGFSTFIPCYNPEDIVDNIFRKMKNKEMKEMRPWYNHFKGKIVPNGENKYDIYGNYDIADHNTIVVNELPIGQWTTPYKEFLETIEYESNKKNKNVIIGFTDNNTDLNVHFAVTFPDKKLELYQKNDTIESKLKLVKSFKTSNMHLYNNEGTINKYTDVLDIIEEFYDTRIDMYTKRKEYLIGKYTNELDLLKYKAKFIRYVIEKKLLFKKKKARNY